MFQTETLTALATTGRDGEEEAMVLMVVAVMERQQQQQQDVEREGRGVVDEDRRCGP